MRVKIRVPGRLKQFWAVAMYSRLLSFTILVASIAGILELADTPHHLWSNISHVLIAAYCVGAICLLAWRMIDHFRYGRWALNILILIAVATALLQRQYWTALVLLAVQASSDAAVRYVHGRIRSRLVHLLHLAPPEATLIRGRKTVTILAKNIQHGDKLIIDAGSVVPADCEIIEGSSEIDEHILTGQPDAVIKSVGDDILAGSTNVSGQLTVRALRTSENSHYRQLLKTVRGLQNPSTPFIRQAERFSLMFSGMVLLIAAGIWVWSGEPRRFLDVLSAATPAGLLFAPALAIVGGLVKSARRGMFVQSGVILERLAGIRTMAFDKAGILNQGLPHVSKVISLSSGTNQKEVLMVAASISSRSSYSKAMSLQEAASARSLRLVKPRGHEEHEGQGDSGLIGRQHVLLGTEDFLKNHGVALSKDARKIKGDVLYMAVDKKLTGAISFDDNLHAQGQEMIDRLRSLGVAETLLLTSDSPKVAMQVAESFGISSVIAEYSNAAKAAALDSIPRTSRPVGFIGTSHADGLLLDAADAGIAVNVRHMGGHSDSFQAVILNHDILKVTELLSLAKSTLRSAQTGVLLGTMLSLAFIAVMATGRIPAIYGALTQLVVTGVVIISALRLRFADLTAR